MKEPDYRSPSYDVVKLTQSLGIKRPEDNAWVCIGIDLTFVGRVTSCTAACHCKGGHPLLTYSSDKSVSIDAMKVNLQPFGWRPTAEVQAIKYWVGQCSECSKIYWATELM